MVQVWNWRWGKNRGNVSVGAQLAAQAAPTWYYMEDAVEPKLKVVRHLTV